MSFCNIVSKFLRGYQVVRHEYAAGRHGTEPRGIILVICMQSSLRPFAVPHADTVLSGRRQLCGFGFGIMVAGGSSKVSAGGKGEEERLVLSPRKCGNAREGLRSGSAWHAERCLGPHVGSCWGRIFPVA